MFRTRRPLTRAVLAAALLAVATLPAAPRAATAAPASQGATLTVFAAASLTDAFRELGLIFEANGGVPVTFNFGASTQLRTQLEQGAPADVFASADQVQMDRARDGGVIAGPDVTIVTNRLVVITPAANPGGIWGPGDLAKSGLRVVTTQPEVPIGVYTQTMLDRMSEDPRFGADFKDRVNANIVSREANVRQIVAKVQLGEADAGVVYRSDVTPQAAPELVTFEVPDEFNTIATYPIALVTGAPQVEAGFAFVALVLSQVGQNVLAKWNFAPIGPVADAPMWESVALSPTPSEGWAEGSLSAARR